MRWSPSSSPRSALSSPPCTLPAPPNIARGWGRGGELADRQGWPELEAWWPGRRHNKPIFLFPFLFLIGMKSGLSVHVNKPTFSLPTQRLQVGPTHQIRCHFAFNSRSVQIANNFLKYRGVLRLKHKVAVFKKIAYPGFMLTTESKPYSSASSKQSEH
jgi:hypothetical protein